MGVGEPKQGRLSPTERLGEGLARGPVPCRVHQCMERLFAWTCAATTAPTCTNVRTISGTGG